LIEEHKLFEEEKQGLREANNRQLEKWKTYMAALFE